MHHLELPTTPPYSTTLQIIPAHSHSHAMNVCLFVKSTDEMQDIHNLSFFWDYDSEYDSPYNMLSSMLSNDAERYLC